MTFSEEPKLVTITGIPKTVSKEQIENINSLEEINALLGDLHDRVRQVSRMTPGYNTDIELAFDEILKVCVENNLPAKRVSNMRLCIFSDMEFDKAKGGGSTSWDTMYDVIEKKFRAAGFPEIPTIVYWNLRSSESIPIQDTNKKGVSLLSGYSAGLMRKFLNGQLEADEEEEEMEINMENQKGENEKPRAKLTPMETLLRILDSEMYEKLMLAVEDMKN